MRSRPLLIFVATAAIFSACSDAPQKVAEKAPPPAPPEPVSGSTAFFRMYTAARGWAGDLQPLRMTSIHLPDVKKVPGKAAAWQATFVSPGRQRARTYTFSVVESSGNLHKDVFAGNEEGWAGRGPVKPFLIQGLKIDTTAAYETAIKKGRKVAEYMKANPDKNVSFLLEQNSKFPDLTWRVIWGESVGTSNYSVFVDATTGEYLETMR